MDGRGWAVTDGDNAAQGAGRGENRSGTIRKTGEA
jgi:hypothetical protein